MGGRGANAKTSGGSQKVMSLDEYLGSLGLRDPLSGYLDDKMRGNRNFSSGNQREKFTKNAHAEIDDYHNKRDAAIKEYNQKLAKGELRAPTAIEKSMKVAHGHPDNKSTQAARRMLEKRGYDWRTGRKK